MIDPNKFASITITSASGLRDWLEANHAQESSVWLVTYKKNNPDKYVSREAVLDELISFGWTDGIRRKMDDDKTMQLISPRKAQHWSASYKVRAERLINEGKMHRAGIASMERSKQLGLWNFMDDVDKLIIPDDLKEALSTSKEALAFFNGINDSSKRFTLRWLKLAKTESTRVKRINRILELSRQGEKLPGS